MVRTTDEEKSQDLGSDESHSQISREGQSRFGWLSISLAAFLMSVTTAGLNAYYSLRGPEIIIQKPQHVLLYRDGEGENAVLSVAIRLEAINTASDHGDVVLDTQLSAGDASVAFTQEGQARPAFTTDAEQAIAKCGLGQSCIGNQGLVVVQRSDEIMDLPGGTAKAFIPYFWLVQHSCTDQLAECEDWTNFLTASRKLASERPEFRLRMDFQNDGTRTIVCRTPIDQSYLAEIGWTQLPCVEASVEGEPWL